MRNISFAFLFTLIGLSIGLMAHPKNPPKKECVVCKQSIVHGKTKSGHPFRIDACASDSGMEYRMYIDGKLALAERVEQGVSILLYEDKALLEQSRKPPEVGT